MTTDRSRRRGLALSALVTPLLAAGAAFAGSADLSRPGGATRLHGDQTSTVRKAVDGSHARHVIVMIGDGMGDSEITSARNDEYGADGRLPASTPSR
jgi:alkaline phosphatase